MYASVYAHVHVFAFHESTKEYFKYFVWSIFDTSFLFTQFDFDFASTLHTSMRKMRMSPDACGLGGGGAYCSVLIQCHVQNVQLLYSCEVYLCPRTPAPLPFHQCCSATSCRFQDLFRIRAQMLYVCLHQATSATTGLVRLSVRMLCGGTNGLVA